MRRRDICYWQLPNGLAILMQSHLRQFIECQSSTIFQHIFHKRTPNITVVEEENLINLIVETAVFYTQEFASCLKRIVEKQIIVDDIVEIFKQSFDKQTKQLHLTTNVTTLCELSNIFFNGVHHFNGEVINELRLAKNLLTFDDFNECMVAWSIKATMQGKCLQHDFEALLKLMKVFQLQGIEMDLIHQLNNAYSADITYCKFADIFIRVLYSANLQNIIPQLVVNFWKVLINEGVLFLLLNSFPDSSYLNRRIDARQNEDLTDETEELLAAVRLVGQVILDHKVSHQLRVNHTIQSCQDLFQLIFDCASIASALKYISGKVDAIEILLQQSSEEKQIITLVKNLLQSGWFVLELKNKKARCYGLLSDHSIIYPEDFEALPSQLLLAYGTDIQSDGIDENETLPELILHAQNDIIYVQRFTAVYSKLTTLVKLIEQLSVSGLPDYQNYHRKIPASTSIKSLVSDFDNMSNFYQSWLNDFTESRTRFPSISLFSRTQIVEWIHAFRCESIDYDTLFNTLTSIGCDVDFDALRDICDAFRNNSADMISYLGVLDHCFNTFHSSANTECAEKMTKSDVEELSAACQHKVRLLRFGEMFSEENLIGFHLLRYHRVPKAWEIFFCSEQSNMVDVEDFFQRWKSIRNIPKLRDYQTTFYLIYPNLLSFNQQSQLASMVTECEEDSSIDSSVQLLFATDEGVCCYITNVFLNKEIMVEQLCKRTKEKINAFMSKQEVYVVFSSSCSAGKSRAVIEHLVCPEKDAERLHAQITIDQLIDSSSLERLKGERPIKSAEGIILHFNIGHKADKRKTSLFLMEYIMIGIWRDCEGKTFPRNYHDVIVIELANTGYFDERNRSPITKYFRQLTIDPRMSTRIYQAIPSSRHGSLIICAENRTNEEKFISCNFIDRNIRWYHFDSKVSLEETSSYAIKIGPYERKKVLYSDIRDVANDRSFVINYSGENSDTIRTYRETMLYRYRYYDSENGDYAPRLLICIYNLRTQSCREMIHHSQVPSLPIPKKDELDLAVRKLVDSKQIASDIQETFIRRFYHFACTLLNNLYSSFTFWSIADSWLDENGDNTRSYILQLTYHYAEMLVNNASDLAEPVMTPQRIEERLDDVTRFEGMRSFEDWKNRAYFVCTANSFRVISIDNVDPLSWIVEKNHNHLDTEFVDWLRNQREILSPLDRRRLQYLCDQIVHNASFTNPLYQSVFKELLESIGCFEGSISIIRALEYLENLAVSDSESVVNYDALDKSREWLNNHYSKQKLHSESSVETFKVIAQSYLGGLLGDSAKKPALRVTVNMIVRLICIQIRMICRIPVCIIGETGCGKTELLQFLAKLKGAHYHVINIQEGVDSKKLQVLLQPTIIDAIFNPNETVICVLDEVNATSDVWLAKDLLCDHILSSIRLPKNINFIVVMNPAKKKSQRLMEIEKEISVGGLDFKRYQRHPCERSQEPVEEMIYQVHSAPETLYSLAWDFGTPCQLSANSSDLPDVQRLMELDPAASICTDEFQIVLDMSDWAINQLKENCDLMIRLHSSPVNTDLYWKAFRTMLVEMIISSHKYLREIFGGEPSVVSLRDCQHFFRTLLVIYQDFCPVITKIRPGLTMFHREDVPLLYLNKSVHCALIIVYCLRLTSKRRSEYLTIIHQRWSEVRRRFLGLDALFLTTPAELPENNMSTIFLNSAIYQSFEEFALILISDLTLESDIAPNQALKENVFCMFLCIWMQMPLFIVGRPGSSKSRALELLCDASTFSKKRNSFITELGLVIHKFVVQCSPDTTADHVNRQARRAAISQRKLSQLSKGRNQCVLILEEVGATIHSKHNPLMSLHHLIDYGVHYKIDGQIFHERLPILGISNYSLDASKMSRGFVVHRGDPSHDDLIMQSINLEEYLLTGTKYRRA